MAGVDLSPETTTWYFQYRGPGDWTYWTTLTHNGRMPDAGHR